jgi:hypothetical protein
MTIKRRIALPLSRRSFCASLALSLATNGIVSSSFAQTAEINYRQFLKDVTGGENAFRHFTTLSTKKKPFLDAYGLEDNDYRTISARTIHAMAVPAALKQDGRAFTFDWSGDLEEFFVELGKLLKKRGSKINIKALEAKAMAYFSGFKPERGEHIGYIYGPVAEALEADSLLLANLNDTSDSYNFFLLPRPMMIKWLGKQLDLHLEIEHPGAYFAKQLKGTAYSKYLDEAPTPGKKDSPTPR